MQCSLWLGRGRSADAQQHASNLTPNKPASGCTSELTDEMLPVLQVTSSSLDVLHLQTYCALHERACWATQTAKAGSAVG